MEKHTIEQEPFNKKFPDSRLLTEVSPIEEGGITPLTRESLAKIVEDPLLEACEELYDKNIQTVMSSANSTDVERGEIYIAINFDSLSDENKQVALQFGQPYSMHGSRSSQCVNISLPVDRNTTVGDIRKMAQGVVSKFHKQEMIWAKRYTRKDLAKMYGLQEEEITPEEFSDMYYDDKTDFFYESEEHYRKANDLD